jgi:hypothetical protein
MLVQLCWKFLLSLIIGLVAGLVGFVQLPSEEIAPLLGVVIGLLSGVSWIMASILNSSSRWANFFNLFAAVFATMAVGYLAPAKDVCRRETIAGREVAPPPAIRGACDLREIVTGHPA